MSECLDTMLCSSFGDIFLAIGGERLLTEAWTQNGVGAADILC